MWNYLWPVLLIVCSNVIYNITSKSTPGGVNPFLSLCITYIVGTIASFAIFYFTSGPVNISKSFRELNWTSYLLGFAIIGLEVGYIYLYRAGWNINTGSLVSNISLAVILIVVGILFYHENLNFKQIAGIVLCIGGLLLITTK